MIPSPRRSTPGRSQTATMARTPRRVHVLGLMLALLGVGAHTACGADDDDRANAAPRPTAPAPSSIPSPAPLVGDTDASDGAPIRITVGDTELTARLNDTATARDLAAQLPLTLTFRDHNGVEKTAPLPRELSLDGASTGHDPAIGHIGYWAPDSDLVLYYDDAPAFEGIVRIGVINGDVEAVKRRSGDFDATVERAQ